MMQTNIPSTHLEKAKIGSKLTSLCPIIIYRNMLALRERFLDRSYRISNNQHSKRRAVLHICKIINEFFFAM